MHNLSRVETRCGSLSGALARHIRKWTRSFTLVELEHFALNMSSSEPWRRLANLVHLHPSKDFATGAHWFLPFCYDPNSLQLGSRLQRLTTMRDENVNELIAEFGDSIAYATQVRKHAKHLNEASKVGIVFSEK